MFCIVYGFSNAALHSWHTPSTWGFLAAGVVLLAGFAWRQAHAAEPLLPPRIVADRNRGGAYLTMLIAATGMFGIFLFLTYYLQQTLGFTPAITGVAFLPMVACLMAASITSNVVLMPRTGPRPLAPAGLLLAAIGLVLLTRIGVHSSYATAVLALTADHRRGFRAGVRAGVQHRHLRRRPPRRRRGLGHHQHRAAARRLDRHFPAQYRLRQHRRQLHRRPSQPGHHCSRPPSQQLTGLALIQGYTTAFWWSAAILAFGAIVAVTLLPQRAADPARPGPRYRAIRCCRPRPCPPDRPSLNRLSTAARLVMRSAR